MTSSPVQEQQEYEEVLIAFAGIGGALLFEFARYGAGRRDRIISHLLARGITMTKGVFSLYALGDYQDGWIIHRALVERLFVLRHLVDRNEFDVFDDWSFVQQYEAARRAGADRRFNKAPNEASFEVSPEEVARAKELKRNPPNWHRPDIERVARKLDMHFLYRYGYDYASTHVHPMANDGARDFYSITKLEPAPAFPDERILLGNTLLVSTMLVQDAMNASSLRWRIQVFEFLDSVRTFLGTGDKDYRMRFVELGRSLEKGIHLAARASAG